MSDGALKVAFRCSKRAQNKSVVPVFGETVPAVLSINIPAVVETVPVYSQVWFAEPRNIIHPVPPVAVVPIIRLPSSAYNPSIIPSLCVRLFKTYSVSPVATLSLQLSEWATSIITFPNLSPGNTSTVKILFQLPSGLNHIVPLLWLNVPLL